MGSAARILSLVVFMALALTLWLVLRGPESKRSALELPESKPVGQEPARTEADLYGHNDGGAVRSAGGAPEPEADPVGFEKGEEPSRGIETAEMVERRLRVFGRVFEASGSACPEATVFLGGRQSTTGPEGEFEFLLTVDQELAQVLDGRGEVTEESLGLDLPLAALAKGHPPAVLESLGGVSLEGDELGPIKLRLDTALRKLEGRLIDEEGEALSAWSIDLFDPSLIVAGLGANAHGGAVHLEGILLPDKPESKTAADGSFRFAALRKDRSYRIRAWNKESLQSFVSDPIPPSVDFFEFGVDVSGIFADVYGSVVGSNGQPLEGVRIRLTMREHEYEMGGEPDSIQNYTGQDLRTDAKGTFHLTAVPHRNVWLRFHGADVAAQPYWFTPESPVEDLRLVLLRQGGFVIESSGLPRPDAFEVWDSLGELVAAKRGGSYDPAARIPLSPEEDLPEYRTTENARWLVLYRQEREIARREFAVTPGKTITISF